MAWADFFFAARLPSGGDAGQRTRRAVGTGLSAYVGLLPDLCIVREFRTIVLIDARVLLTHGCCARSQVQIGDAKPTMPSFECTDMSGMASGLSYLFATTAPALRVARIDPAKTLRED